MTSTLQGLEVFEHRIKRGKLKVFGDLLHAGRITVLVHEICYEIQDFLLPFGQLHEFHLSYTLILGDEKVNVKKKMPIIARIPISRKSVEFVQCAAWSLGLNQGLTLYILGLEQSHPREDLP